MTNPEFARYVWEIVLGAHSYFEKEASLVDVDIPEGQTIDVIGDVHGTYRLKIAHLFIGHGSYLSGQFYDYLHLLSLTGEPSETHSLLMNGDLVDRGSWSVEVIVVALAFKCEYKTRPNATNRTLSV